MLDEAINRLILFKNFSLDQRALLRPLFLLRYLPVGTELFKQGEQAEYLYVVVEGEVHIHYKPEDGPELSVARIQSEGVVGWSAVIGRTQYTSSAVCVTDCQLLCARSQDLRQLCEDHPETGKRLLERLTALVSKRLRDSHKEVMALLEQGLHVDVDRPVEIR